MKKLSGLGLIFLLVLILIGSAEAVPVYGTFSGTITTVNDDNDFFPLLTAGTSTFTGTFSYESTTPLTSSSSTMSVYDAISFTLNLGGIYSLVAPSPEVQISNEYGFFRLDRFAVIDGYPTVDPGDLLGTVEGGTSPRVFDYIYFWLTVAYDADLYSDTALPDSVSYSDFGGDKGFILSNDSPVGYNRTPKSFQIFGEFTSVTSSNTSTAVPEPTTMLLLGLGLFGLVGVRKFNK
jgi:hypothetical protein